MQKMAALPTKTTWHADGRFLHIIQSYPNYFEVDSYNTCIIISNMKNFEANLLLEQNHRQH